VNIIHIATLDDNSIGDKPLEESRQYPLDSEDKAGLQRDLTCIASTLRWDGKACTHHDKHTHTQQQHLDIRCQQLSSVCCFLGGCSELAGTGWREDAIASRDQLSVMLSGSSLIVQLAQMVLQGSKTVTDVQQLQKLVWEPVLARCEKKLGHEMVDYLSKLWPTAIL
jgi:hypothetical protein